MGLESPGYLQSLKFAIMVEIARCKTVNASMCVNHQNIERSVVSLSDAPVPIGLWLLFCEREGECHMANSKVGERVLPLGLLCGDK